MSPIRVGLVGLSTSSNPRAPGAWGVNAHLPSLLNSPSYTITAVCNSSVASAEASIAHHKLGDAVIAYGSPQDLAKDPNVDMVVVSVNVDKHYALAKPAILAKKDIFVEWPLGVNTEEAEELTMLANREGVKTIVGLQARADPMVVKIKELVDSGRIGEVKSSTVVGQFGGIPSDVWIKSAVYYLDAKSGGNALTIYAGHFLDTFTHVLGDITHLRSVLKTQYPTIKLLDDATGEVIDPKYVKTAPDHILIQGILSSGAIASISYRTVTKAVDAIGVRWLITGTKGELEITTPEVAWQMGPPGATIKICNADDGSVEAVEFGGSGEASKVAFPGKNTAFSYEAFAKGDTGKYATFEDSLKTHHLLDSISKSQW